jgi:hypothetical protein
MMNLELLFHSANLTGNNTLRQIAISHANATMKNHIRADGKPLSNNTSVLARQNGTSLFKFLVLNVYP